MGSNLNKKNGGNTNNNNDDEEEMMKPRHHRLGLGATPMMMLPPCPKNDNKNDNKNSHDETNIDNKNEEIPPQSPPGKQNKNSKESCYGLSKRGKNRDDIDPNNFSNRNSSS